MKRRCRVCGCTDDRACPGGCAWLDEPPLELALVEAEVAFGQRGAKLGASAPAGPICTSCALLPTCARVVLLVLRSHGAERRPIVVTLEQLAHESCLSTASLGRSLVRLSARRLLVGHQVRRTSEGRHLARVAWSFRLHGSSL
jgi:hypothetical protein